MESTQQEQNITIPKDTSDNSIEEELRSHDTELLAFQKQRSTPKVSLSAICEQTGVEKELVEVDNFGAMADNPQYIGMLSAGKEEELLEFERKKSASDEKPKEEDEPKK